MLNLLKKIVFSLFLLLPLAQAKDADVEKLTGYLNRLQTMQATFTQKTFDRKGVRVLQENYGSMIFKKPGLFRWSVEKPIQQLIVTNGHKLWVYDIDLEQVSVQEIKKDQHDKPAMVLLSNPDKLQKQFYIRQFKDHKPGEWFELTPKKNESQFVKMALYFEKGHLQQLQFEDAAGQLSDIGFTRIKRNLTVSNKTFDFTPPKGVDIVGMN